MTRSSSDAAVPKRVGRGRYGVQAAAGLALAGVIVAAWLAVHIAGVFILPPAIALMWAPVLIVTQCWLSVGLFIVAHDAMHGSLAPFRPVLNRVIGRAVLLFYAGIWYDALVARHFAHHRAPGTDGDPDFSGDGANGFWRWYGDFFLEYLSAGQLVRLALATGFYLVVLGASPGRMMLFWAVPALLSSLQLFFFGTYLPHRRDENAFADAHRARSNDFAYLVSLATCFHFGYHHEHHSDPSVPWWRLPGVRRAPAPPNPGSRACRASSFPP